MKVISTVEMEHISGAGIVDFLNGSQAFVTAAADAVLGGLYGAVSGAAFASVIGGYYGGSSGGGVLGVGMIGTVVGFFAGVVLGGALGAVVGAYDGVSAVDDFVTKALNSFSSGSWIA